MIWKKNLSFIDLGQNVKSIFSHGGISRGGACAKRMDNSIVCWGEQMFGDAIGNSANEMGVNLPIVNIIWL